MSGGGYNAGYGIRHRAGKHRHRAGAANRRWPIRTTREALDKVLADLPEARLWEVIDFARYLRWLEKEEREERHAWQRLSPALAAELTGPEEDEYTEADIKPELNR